MAANRPDAAEDRATPAEQAAPADLADPARAGPIATATRVPTPFDPADGEAGDADAPAAAREAADPDDSAGADDSADPIYPRTRAP
jgi:hypothetical protein